jgi:hypothetical protein
MAPAFSPGLLAAGLTMIISMNATVCGDTTMVSKRRFKIIGSDGGEECLRAKKTAVARGKGNLRLMLEVMVLGGSRGAGRSDTCGLSVPWLQWCGSY